MNMLNKKIVLKKLNEKEFDIVYKDTSYTYKQYLYLNSDFFNKRARVIKITDSEFSHFNHEVYFKKLNVYKWINIEEVN